jgi:hypothetical protein
VTAPPGLQCGDVISIFDYKFDDGTTADSKYYVVMGYHLGQAFGFLTTSQQKGGRQKVEGCNPGRGNYPYNFFVKVKGTNFADGTWVLLEAEWLDAKLLNQKMNSGKAVRALTFSDQTMRAIRNCFEKSPGWAPICAEYMCGGKSSG